MASRPGILNSQKRDDDAQDTSLRPQRLSEFIGQQQARANLSVFIEAAKTRKEALDHVLLVGPPGLGKTTMAQILSRELGVNFRATSGPVIAKAGDLAALLTNLEERDVLFIDEIHRLNPGGRGNPLSRDGGLSARSDHRRRAGGALGQDRPRQVHARRRHHPRGPAHHAAARPFRHPDPAQLLHRSRAGGDRDARRARAEYRHEQGRRQRDRAPRPRHAAHRRTAAAPRARLRARRRRRRRSTAVPPTARCSRSKSMPPGSTPSTAAISA